MILGGRPNHRRPADVDILDAIVERGALLDRRFERIEIDHEQIDWPDLMLLHRRDVLFVAADREQAAMHFRMQRLNAAIHHFGRASQFGDIDYGKSGILESLGGAARRNQFNAEARQGGCKCNQPGLVGDRKQSAGYASRVAGHEARASTSTGRKCIRP